MARPKSQLRPYTEKEQQYIERVAGKVPVQVIAMQLNRSISGIRQWANTHNIKLRVPHAIMVKHWREYVTGSKRTEAKNLQAL